MNSHAVVLIVARPGRLRDGWRALLLAMRRIESVFLADEASTATCTAKTLGPDLVLLDADALGDADWNLLLQIKAEQPACRSIALVRDARQLEQALSAGADAGLIKGFPAAGLFETVERLLADGARESTTAGA